MGGSPLRVYISYSRDDRRFLKPLVQHLATLKQNGEVSEWHEGRILPGQNRAEVISAELEAAEIVILLLSPSFLASEDRLKNDMARSLERQRSGKARVVPVLVESCDWQNCEPIAGLEVLPASGRAVAAWSKPNDAWLEIVGGLRRVIAAIREPAAAPVPARSTLFSLPYPRNPFFTGREDVLARIAEQLRSGGRVALGQVAAISGLGGIGKTQTAVEFAYRHRDDYRAVFFVRSETEGEIVADFATMAAKLTLPQGNDQNVNAQAARRWLEENEAWLLILDNADTPTLLEPFLPKDGKGHVLITSRARNFAAVHLKSPLRLSSPSGAEALAFLLERTGRSDASGAEERAAAELAAELGNLPLALEQAAAYISTCEVSFAAYLEEFRARGLEVVGRSDPEAGTRHQPVELTWSLNFRQVENEFPASADLLRAAAFCAPDAIPDEFFLEGGGVISKRLGEAVASGDLLVVAELAKPLLRYSLMERDAEGRTLSLHRLVQEVVKRDLGEAGAPMLQAVVKALCRVFPWPNFETWPRCERLLSHVLAVAKGVVETNDLAGLLNAAGSYLRRRGRFAEAQPPSERALAIREKSLGGDHPDVASSLNCLASLYREQGRHSEAEPLSRRALAIREKSLGGDHPEVANSLNNLASLYWYQGRYSEAMSLYDRALAIREASLGGDHPDVAQSLNNLANLYRLEDRYSEAQPLYERSLAILEKSLGGEHPDVATSLNNLALLYVGQGRHSQAEPLYERSLAIREKSLGSEHPHVATSLNNLAELYLNQGRHSEAEPFYERALAIWEKSLGGDHPDVAMVLENLAILRRKQGRDAEAGELEARAREVRARHAARNPPRDPPK